MGDRMYIEQDPVVVWADTLRFMATDTTGKLDDHIRGIEAGMRSSFPADELAGFQRRFVLKDDILYILWVEV